MRFFTGGECDAASLDVEGVTGTEGAFPLKPYFEDSVAKADAQSFRSDCLGFDSEGISEVVDDMAVYEIFGRMRWREDR